MSKPKEPADEIKRATSPLRGVVRRPVLIDEILDDGTVYVRNSLLKILNVKLSYFRYHNSTLLDRITNKHVILDMSKVFESDSSAFQIIDDMNRRCASLTVVLPLDPDVAAFMRAKASRRNLKVVATYVYQISTELLEQPAKEVIETIRTMSQALAIETLLKAERANKKRVTVMQAASDRLQELIGGEPVTITK